MSHFFKTLGEEKSVEKKKRRIRGFSIIATVLMIFSLFSPGMTSAESANDDIYRSLNDSKTAAKDKISNRLSEEFEESDKVTFLIKMEEKADTDQVVENIQDQADTESLSSQKLEHMQRSAVISELKSTAIESQQNVKAFLQDEVEQGNAEQLHAYYIVNGLAVTATKEVAEKVAAFTEVEKILPNENRQLISTVDTDEKQPEADDDVEWNIDRVNAPQAWEMGADGSGTVVAIIDTGVLWDHSALKEKYRGYDADSGEVDHDFNWYDATVGEDEPYDDIGHGTHVTGTIVGSEPDGTNQIGVAPGAKYMSVKAFTEAGGTDEDLLDAAEWIMAPTDADGNERVDLAPDVVNNSWGGGPGLDEWYRDVVKEWRNAGIFPEFSAGNVDLLNPGGPESVAAPANYPESFATGATDSEDVLADFSLLGPSPYDEIKPDISAPGVSIRSSMPDGDYGMNSGTSMAGPAVSGVAALLRSVDADLSVDDMEEILLNTATALTDDDYPESPNNGYGYGLVDAQNAVSSIQDGLGTLEGTVGQDGEDNEEPTFSHEAPSTTYSDMDLDLTIEASDNVSVSSVEVEYESEDASGTATADLVDGDYKDGEYAATIPGEDITGEELSYHIIVNDYGDNTVTSDAYTIEIQEGITVGYEEDFAQDPPGWYSFGDEDSWEWGEPDSGPGSAASGDNVYATNLDGEYESNTNATLVMPPIDLPEDDSYLQFEHWYDLEIYDSGNAYDFAHVFVSTDMEEWEQLERYEGSSGDWEVDQVELSDYSGERIYIGFNLESDLSVNEDGWYIDNVTLSDTSIDTSASLMDGTDKTSAVMDRHLDMTELNTAVQLSLATNGGNEQGVEDREAEKEEVNPDNITPTLPETDKEPIEADADIASLPLDASVTVVDSERTVNTNPADGSYSLVHPAGTFSVLAESYGFHSDEQEVTIEDDEVTEANFVLDELDEGTVTGTITNEATGDAVEDATILLEEDANIEPVHSDEDGNYSLTAYEGDYTMKVMARDFHSDEVDIEITEGEMEVNVALEPFYTYPGGEIGYDDGTAENALSFYDAGNGWAVKMSLPDDKESAVVTEGVFQFWDDEFPDPGSTDFAVEVWDSSGEDGMPGEKLAGPIDAEAVRDLDEWTIVDLSEENIIVEDDFYMVYIQSVDNPLGPGLATDEDSPNSDRNYRLVDGTWENAPLDEGNYMIRSRVNYELETPVINSPNDGDITSDKDVTVEGTASPTTEVKLLNSGEDVGVVDVDDDGEFSIPIELNEGANELVAVNVMDDEEVDESEPVNITLDTTAPELTIDKPADGEKTNRETVTVEGTVQDDHLDYVEVNGQSANVSDGHYSKRILLDNGENDISVVAVDEAGNESTETVTIDVNYDGPEIENLTPDEDVDLETGKSVKIEFDSEPGLKPTFFIHMPLTNNSKQIANATELPMMEEGEGHYVGYWTVPKDVHADGAIVEVKVVDDYDNEVRQETEGKLFINMDE